MTRTETGRADQKARIHSGAVWGKQLGSRICGTGRHALVQVTVGQS